MNQAVFNGLHNLEAALEFYKKTQVVEEAATAPPDAFTAQTQEIRMLASGANLLTQEQKIGLAHHPIWFNKAFVSDSLDCRFRQFGLEFGWMYSQYRTLKNARLLGIQKSHLKDFENYMAKLPIADEEIRVFLETMFEGSYKDWTFVGKPVKSDFHAYYLLLPSELANMAGTIFIKTWTLLE